MPKLSEARHPCEYLVSERGMLSRGVVTIGPSQRLQPGEVLGRVGLVAAMLAAAVAVAGNVGNGTLTFAGPPVDASAVEGAYLVTFTDPTQFEVEAPNGKTVDVGTVGTAFASGVRFTIAAGGTAFAAGDQFSIQVTADERAEQFVALNPAANDGSQRAAAIAMYPAVTGAGKTTQITATKRLTEVRASDLTWPVGISAAAKAQAIADLARLDIILR